MPEGEILEIPNEVPHICPGPVRLKAKCYVVAYVGGYVQSSSGFRPHTPGYLHPNKCQQSARIFRQTRSSSWCLLEVGSQAYRRIAQDSPVPREIRRPQMDEFGRYINTQYTGFSLWWQVMINSPSSSNPFRNQLIGWLCPGWRPACTNGLTERYKRIHGCWRLLPKKMVWKEGIEMSCQFIMPSLTAINIWI